MLEQFSRWLRRYQGTEANPLYRLAVDVATGKITFERALDAAQSYQVNARLADGDLLELDQQVEFEAQHNLDFALILAKLNAAAARAKGFDKVLVDLQVRVGDLLEPDHQDAEREHYYGEALFTAQRISYLVGQRRALNRMARICIDRGDVDMARELMQEQLDAGREENDGRDEIETAILLADIANSDGDAGAAHDYYHRAARSARRIGFYTGAVDALLHQVAIVRERDDLQGSLMLLRQAGDAAERTVDAGLQAEVAFRTGAVLCELGMTDEAVEQLSFALERARAIGDLSLESRCLELLSQLEQRLGQHEDALRHFSEVVQLESRLGNRAEVARAQLAIGEMHLSSNRPHEAIDAIREARDLVAQTGDTELSVEVHGLLGQAFAVVGRDMEALGALEQAVSGARAAGDSRRELRWLVTAAEIMLRSGEAVEAALIAQRAEDLVRTISDYGVRASVFSLLGQVALVEQRLEDAEDAFTSAVAAARSDGRTDEVLRFLPLLARLALESRTIEEAVRYLDIAVDDANRLGDSARASAFEGQAARIYAGAGRYDDAVDRYHRALDIAERGGDTRSQARALQGLGAIYDTDDQLDLAIEYYEQALDAASRANDSRTIAASHFNLGALLVDLDRDDEARVHLTRARDAAQALHDTNLVERSRTLLNILAPPSFSHDGGSSDLPISEAPVRPRRDSSTFPV
jgi:tetratricopeptide (TPR) repeat protein